MVNSASIMSPCLRLYEVADYAKAHPKHDMGLHLYLRLGREYGIPAMFSTEILQLLPAGDREKVASENIVVDRVLTATPEDFK